MVSHHYKHLPVCIDWHSVVDDFGTLHTTNYLPVNAWWNAYRFANVVSFEEAGMHSHNQAVSEH